MTPDSVVTTREFKPSLDGVMRVVGQDSRSQGHVWSLRWTLILAVGCIGWVAFSFLTTGNLRVLEPAAIGLLAAALFWFVVSWAMPRLVEKRPHNKNAFTPRRYQFDSQTLSLETADGVALKAPYRTFSRISMGANYIVFYESFPGFAAHVIPSEAFESKDQETVVRDWLAHYAA